MFDKIFIFIVISILALAMSFGSIFGLSELRAEYANRAIAADDSLPTVDARVVEINTSRGDANPALILNFIDPYTKKDRIVWSRAVYSIREAKQILNGEHEINTKTADGFAYVAVRIGAGGQTIVLPYREDNLRDIRIAIIAFGCVGVAFWIALVFMLRSKLRKRRILGRGTIGVGNFLDFCYGTTSSGIRYINGVKFWFFNERGERIEVTKDIHEREARMMQEAGTFTIRHAGKHVVIVIDALYASRRTR